MNFTKMQGAGNDFIILDNREEGLSREQLSRVARTLCQRRRSIGADGLMAVVDAKSGGDYGMLFFNSDGSLGEMCGNGARCIARYGYEHGLAGEIQHIETTAGLVIGKRVDRSLYRVQLNDASVVKLDRDLEVDERHLKVSYVELGNPGIPHAVVEWKGLSDLGEKEEQELFRLGRLLRYHPAFPKGANVNFYEILGKNHILEKTYERGVEDFTLACGTGTGSLVTVLFRKGLVEGENVQVDMAGGTLFITLEQKEEGESIFLTGPTNVVATGRVMDDALADALSID